MRFSTQSYINCVCIQSSLLSRPSFRKSKFCYSEGGRLGPGHPLYRNGRFGKRGGTRISPTLHASPTLTPPSATVPAAASLDYPTHCRQNLARFANPVVCCSRQLPVQSVLWGGFAPLSKICCILHFYWVPRDNHWLKGREELPWHARCVCFTFARKAAAGIFSLQEMMP